MYLAAPPPPTPPPKERATPVQDEKGEKAEKMKKKVATITFESLPISSKQVRARGTGDC